MSEKHRIFLVDDHPAMLDGLRAMIARLEAWEVCGEARTAAAAIEQVSRLNPDLTIIDVSLPDQNGIELMEELQKRAFGLKFLVFSMHDDPAYAQRAIRAGARGFLSKAVNSNELIAAMERILGGGVYLSRETAEDLTKRFSKAFSKGSMSKMSELEWEVFDQIGSCRTNSEIASALGISPREVDSYRAELRRKLDIEDPQKLMREAMLWAEVRRSGDALWLPGQLSK